MLLFLEMERNAWISPIKPPAIAAHKTAKNRLSLPAATAKPTRSLNLCSRTSSMCLDTHRANKDKCSGHYIRAVVLEQIVWRHIQEVVSVVTRYEAYFRSEMEQKLRIQSEESLRLSQKRLAQAEKRIGELARLFIRIYEDNVSGRLDDERFAMMSKNYTEEQKDLKAEVKNLQQQIHEREQQAENIEQFVQRVKRNSTLTELTPYALRELVKAVYVDAPDKSSGKRRQKVHIEYDLVGYIPVDELLKAEQA